MPKAIAFGGADDLTFAKQAYAVRETVTCHSCNHESYERPERVVLRKRCLGAFVGYFLLAKQNRPDMSERSPLFLGLARPPKYLGLPVGYLVVLAMGVVLPFIWTKSMIFFLIGIVAYPILWFVADKEPHFFEVLRVSYGTVRTTKNRSIWGGDSFGS